LGKGGLLFSSTWLLHATQDLSYSSFFLFVQNLQKSDKDNGGKVDLKNKLTDYIDLNVFGHGSPFP